jgi:hypothetical protein
LRPASSPHPTPALATGRCWIENFCADTAGVAKVFHSTLAFLFASATVAFGQPIRSFRALAHLASAVGWLDAETNALRAPMTSNLRR